MEISKDDDLGDLVDKKYDEQDSHELDSSDLKVEAKYTKELNKGAKDVLKIGIKRERSQSPKNDETNLAEPRKLRAKLSSFLIQPDRTLDLDIEKKREALLESHRSDPQILARNKRMFGMLMGTLQKFKTEETGRESVTLKRCKVEEKLETSTREREASDVAVKSSTTVQLLKRVDKAEARLDEIGRFKNWEKTHRHLGGYIRTETKPRIFWLPRLHNSKTEQRLKETRDYYSLFMAERTAKFKKELEKHPEEEGCNVHVSASAKEISNHRSDEEQT